jgi:four helix bundle protein
MPRSDFEKLRVYQLAEMLADFVWEVVLKWDRLAQGTVGRQLINSADSIGANIAEGSGRGSFADNRRFARIARGSLFEVKHWRSGEPITESSCQRLKLLDSVN